MSYLRINYSNEQSQPSSIKAKTYVPGHYSSLEVALVDMQEYEWFYGISLSGNPFAIPSRYITGITEVRNETDGTGTQAEE